MPRDRVRPARARAGTRRRTRCGTRSARPGPRAARRTRTAAAHLRSDDSSIVLQGRADSGERGAHLREHRPERPVEPVGTVRSEEHTSELQSPDHLVCRLLLEKKKHKTAKQSQTKKNQRTTLY